MALLTKKSLQFCIKAYRQIKNKETSVVKEDEFTFHKNYNGENLVFFENGKYITAFDETLLDVFLDSDKYK